MHNDDRMWTEYNGQGGAISGWLSLLNSRETAVGNKITVTTAGTPIVPASAKCGAGATFIANTANTGIVYVFPAAGEKTDVIPLSPGDSLFWPISDIAAIKVDSSVSGDSVYWMGAV